MKEEIYEPSLEEKNVQRFRKPGPGRLMGHIFAPGVSHIKGAPMGGPEFDTEAVERFMDGAIDIHIHPYPDPYMPRIGDQIDLAIEACQAGMGGVLFKCHQIPTAATVPLVQKVVNQWAGEHRKRRLDVFGGVVLNYAVGGLNPAAVEAYARIGGRVVWPPNCDSSHFHALCDVPGGIDILDEDDNVVAPMKEILSMIAEGDLVLNMSCLYVKEVFHLIDEAKKVGVQRLNWVHPNHPCSLATVEQMKIAADKGVYIELTHNFGGDSFSWEVFMQAYKLIGPDKIIGSTDAGWFALSTPVVAMRAYISGMLLHGIPEQDVEKMVKTNPRELLYP